MSAGPLLCSDNKRDVRHGSFPGRVIARGKLVLTLEFRCVSCVCMEESSVLFSLFVSFLRGADSLYGDVFKDCRHNVTFSESLSNANGSGNYVFCFFE